MPGSPGRPLSAIEIEGRTLGVIGLGKLGGQDCRLAQAFGMNVIAWSPNLTPEECKEAGVTYASKEELFGPPMSSPFMSCWVSVPAGLVGRDDLARMKPTAYIVNTARGPIIDEDALLKPCSRRRSRAPASTCSRSNRCRSTTPSASSTTW